MVGTITKKKKLGYIMAKKSMGEHYAKCTTINGIFRESPAYITDYNWYLSPGFVTDPYTIRTSFVGVH